ncbi:uncharacterized protein LOC110807908 isoform X2 [Carica papaya]|uniref:uncharacterized protein LOC110807908 isoform X2 n=1 Tax=Carica papaya TaxID=3649 RepID=UPI000B8C8CAA|nr:uncharacterized protein LOC110807908 isoform X2 [Carica papaya]
MSYSIQSFNKRKRFSPVTTNPLTGTFTRSKSQIYIHRNRSGRSRRDSVRLRSHHNVDIYSCSPTNKKSRRKLPQESHAADGEQDLSSSVSVIDLRSRRVFSPVSSIQNECELRKESLEKNGFEKEGEGLEDVSLCDAQNLYGKSPRSRLDVDGIFCNRLDDIVKVCEGNEVARKLEIEFSCEEVSDSDRGGLLGVADVHEDEKTEKLYAEISCKDEDLEDKGHDSCIGRDDMACDGIEVRKGGDSVELEPVNLKLSYGRCSVDELGRGEDSGISNGVADDLEEQNMRTRNRHVKIDRPNQEIAQKGIIKEINASQQNAKSVLNPGYRGKLFKAPGSFSYGRLLPYLMDIAKDSPCKWIPDDRFQTGHHNSDSGNRFNSTSSDCLPNLRGKEGSREICNAQKSDGVPDHIKGSHEECGQTTPPDIGHLSELRKDQDDRTKDILQSVGCALKKPSNGDFQKNNSGEERSVSNSKGKSVLNRCSQRMLFKTPGSLGYRRLLPFFMGITKDNSCSSGNCGIMQNEKRLEEKVTSPSLVSDCQGTPRGNSSSESEVECSNSDRSALPLAPPNAGGIPSETDTIELASLEHGSQPSHPVHCHKEKGTQVEDAELTKRSEAARGFENEPPTMSSQSCVGSLSVLREGALSISNQVPVSGDGNCSIVRFANDAKLPEKNSLHQSTSQLEVSPPPRIIAVGYQKGILKRTPHGDRELSTCLNCSSYREDAEKAFEFSRNQMRDAEEVVLYLAKELSCLRDMLEKSADDHDHLCVNKVKEACRKASEAEELAKDRLRQVKDNLYVPCRIPVSKLRTETKGEIFKLC